MESEFIAQLLDLGITGLFIGYLLWSNKAQSARLDAYVTRLLTTLSELEETRELGYEKIRDRYDDVVKDLNATRDTLLVDISKKLDEGLAEMRRKFEDERLERISRRSSGGADS